MNNSGMREVQKTFLQQKLSVRGPYKQSVSFLHGLLLYSRTIILFAALVTQCITISLCLLQGIFNWTRGLARTYELRLGGCSISSNYTKNITVCNTQLQGIMHENHL